MTKDHQLSGAFTIVVNLDRIADKLAADITARVADWLNLARPMDQQLDRVAGKLAADVTDQVAEWLNRARPMDQQPAPAGTYDYHRTAPDPQLPADSDPGGWRPSRAEQGQQPEPGFVFVPGFQPAAPVDPPERATACRTCAGNHHPEQSPCPPGPTGPADPRWHDPNLAQVEQPDGTVAFMPEQQ
jgi:hypothetical protein